MNNSNLIRLTLAPIEGEEDEGFSFFDVEVRSDDPCAINSIISNFYMLPGKDDTLVSYYVLSWKYLNKSGGNNV